MEPKLYRRILKAMKLQKLLKVINSQKLNVIKNPKAEIFKTCLHLAKNELKRRKRLEKQEIILIKIRNAVAVINYKSIKQEDPVVSSSGHTFDYLSTLKRSTYVY